MYNVSSRHQKYFGETQQNQLMKTRRDSVEVHVECKSVLVHLMARIGRQKAEHLFFIDGKLNLTMKNKRKWQDQQCNDDRMARSEA
jgi:hypothetical protein